MSHAFPHASFHAPFSGWSGALPTKHYSGYLQPSGGKFLHYYLVESTNNPATDPVVFWFNGGPGCSSMLGFFTENGPFAVESAGANGGEPKLTLRDTAWNMAGANVVFLEAPVGVGLSYASNPATGYILNDTITAQDNLQAVLAFFNGWPEWRDNEFYLTGESYAGVYVPTLALQIVKHNSVAPAAQRVNLKGIAVGNGCIGNEVGSCAVHNDSSAQHFHLEFYHGMGAVSQALYEDIQATCQGEYSNPSAACVSLLADMHQQIGPVDVYNFDGPCVSAPPQGGSSSSDDISAASKWEFGTGTRKWTRGRRQTALEARISAELLQRVQAQGDGVDSFTGVKPGPGPLECIGDGEQGPYLDRDDVRAALHVEPVSKIGHWNSCVEKTNWFYTTTEANEPRDVYPTLLKALDRILIYSGQADGCVPFVDSEAWTSGMGVPVAKGGEWRPWYTSESQVGGYVTYYEGDFTFLTVTAAGHMVPQFQPAKAFDMFTRFLKGGKY